MSKVYADGSSELRTYDAFNRLATITDARGVVKTHTYDVARGLLLSESYSNDTNNRTYLYNFLAMPVQISDDAGVRNFAYNSFNELETDSLVADSVTHLVTELRDNYGRSVGYTYAKNNSVQQTTSVGYGIDGRISTAGFVHGGAVKQFNYAYLNGAHLLQTLTMPNNMSLTQGFEKKRDLLTQMAYKRGNTLVSQRVYTYDALGRPLTRQTSRNGQTVNDSFVHTYRSELASAQVNGQTYAYDYDNIGNRRMSIDASDYAFYDANELNQYSSIRKNEDPAFVPTFDAAGNQTLVRTATGTWSVTYNAENRPVIFQKTTDSVTTRITCTYDYMGRRATKKVEEITTDAEGNETTTVISNHRFIYRGYLQIGCCDLSRANHPCLWLITWDPTQPVATRPLAIQKDGTWFCYGWDLTKNICEIFGQNGYIRSTYAYTPFGSVTANGDINQPIQWSSEYYDNELALVYYNYRHYNPTDGRWINRDPIAEQSGWNLYGFVGNSVINHVDKYGLFEAINISLSEVPWSILNVGDPFPIKKTQKFQATSDAVAVENIQVSFEPESIKTPDGNLWGLKSKITYKFAIYHRQDIKPDDSLPTTSPYNTYRKHETHHIGIYIKWYNKYYEKFHNISKAQFCRLNCARALALYLYYMYKVYMYTSYYENYIFDINENKKMNKLQYIKNYEMLAAEVLKNRETYLMYSKTPYNAITELHKCVDKRVNRKIFK